MNKYQQFIFSESFKIAQKRSEDIVNEFEVMIKNKGHNPQKIVEGRSYFGLTIKHYILNQPSKVCRYGTSPMDPSKSFGPSIENHNKQMQDRLQNKKRDFDVLLHEQSENREMAAFRVVSDRVFQNNEILKLNESETKISSDSSNQNDVTLRFAKKGRNDSRNNKLKNVRANKLKANHLNNKLNGIILNLNNESDKANFNEQILLSEYFDFRAKENNEAKNKRISDNLKKIESFLSFESGNFISFDDLKINQVDKRIMMPSVSVFKFDSGEIPDSMLSMYSKILYESGLYQDTFSTLHPKTCYISNAHTSVISLTKTNEIPELSSIRSEVLALNVESITRNRTPSKIVIAFCVEEAAYTQVSPTLII
jgi:hypothetical protein